MKNEEVLKEYEELFSIHRDKLPQFSNNKSPKMEYHVLADAVFWEDEGFHDEDDLDLENPFRFVIHYRTYLITNHGEPSELSKSVFELAKKYFPTWIGFKESRCQYNHELAFRIARIRKVSNWKIDKMFNESAK